MHLADAFIQSDLHCIQVTVSTFLSALAFPGNRTHDFGVASAMLYQLSYRKAVRSKLFGDLLFFEYYEFGHTTRIPEMLGHCLHLNKIKTKRISNHMS